jgi:hypothetical protein
MYDRGDLPVRLEQGRRNCLKWTADLANIDLHYYLPIFFDGLLETQVGGACLGKLARMLKVAEAYALPHKTHGSKAAKVPAEQRRCAC